MTNPMNLLAAGIKGKSDSEIEQGAALSGGTKAMLDLLFQGMASSLDPAKAEDSTVTYTLKTEATTFAYTLTIKEGKAKVESKDLGNAPVVHLVTNYADFVRLLTGEIDGISAAFQGRLQVAGDQQLAGRLAGMFSTT